MAPHVVAFLIPHGMMESQLLQSDRSFKHARKVAYEMDWAMVANTMH